MLLSRRVGCIAVLIVVAIILITFAVLGAAAVRRYDNYLTGFWVGNPMFLEKAQLSDFQLFIAPREDGCRQGYLIITDADGEFISNQAIEINERGGAPWWAALRAAAQVKHDIYAARLLEIEYDSEGDRDSEGGCDAEGGRGADEPPMPNTLKMTLSILDGTLTLVNDGKVYAFLEKDLASSTAAVEAYSA